MKLSQNIKTKSKTNDSFFGIFSCILKKKNNFKYHVNNVNVYENLKNKFIINETIDDSFHVDVQKYITKYMFINVIS